jgi:hypothetical protein
MFERRRVVEVIRVRNERAQRVVAAGRYNTTKIAPRRALRAREIRQEGRRPKADGERRHAARE